MIGIFYCENFFKENHMLFYLLIAASVTAIFIVCFIVFSNNEKEDEPKTFRYFYKDGKVDGENMGAPVFTEGFKNRRLALIIQEGSIIWAITPYGPLKMEILNINDERNMADVGNESFKGVIHLDPEYLSESMANRLSSSTGVWRLVSISCIGDEANKKGADLANWLWLEKEYFHDKNEKLNFGTFYYFLFDGFDKHYNDYRIYLPPILVPVEMPEVKTVKEGQE